MLRDCEAFIFDLDGTLTVAVHDFDAIRAELGLPVGRPILEELATLPLAEAAELRERLDEEIAKQEKPDARVPLDRDPVPGPFEELVREYYERLGSGE